MIKWSNHVGCENSIGLPTTSKPVYDQLEGHSIDLGP